MNSKRTQNAKQRSDAILKQALRVFASQGFHSADVQLIADRAKVGKGTIYRHFGNKRGLFFATGKYCVEKLGEYVLQKLGGEDCAQDLLKQQGPAEMLKRIAVVCAQFYQENPQAIEIMIQERAEFRESVYPTHLKHRAETRAGVDELIQVAVATGEFRNLNARAVTDAYADLLFGSVVNGCLEGARSKIVKRVEQAMDVFICGLFAHPAADNPNRKAFMKSNTP